VSWGHCNGSPSCILSYLDQSHYYFFQVAPQFYYHFSQNLAALGIKHRTSESVARNSDHYTTEAIPTDRRHSKNNFSVFKEIENINPSKAQLGFHHDNVFSYTLCITKKILKCGLWGDFIWKTGRNLLIPRHQTI
jgi:hypothetical protein